MLYEKDVVKAVCTYLMDKGYRTQSVPETKDKGDDIVAEKQIQHFQKLYIEAKGEGSSSSATKRYGKTFNSTQVRSSVAQAFYTAVACLDRPYNASVIEVRVGIALPDTGSYRKYVERIQTTLQKLEVAVFWVAEDHSVKVDVNWPL